MSAFKAPPFLDGTFDKLQTSWQDSTIPTLKLRQIKATSRKLIIRPSWPVSQNRFRRHMTEYTITYIDRRIKLMGRLAQMRGAGLLRQLATSNLLHQSADIRSVATETKLIVRLAQMRDAGLSRQLVTSNLLHQSAFS